MKYRFCLSLFVLLIEIVSLISLTLIIFGIVGFSWEYFFIGGFHFFIIMYRLLEYKQNRRENKNENDRL